MDSLHSSEQIEPRILRYRKHFQVYFVFFVIIYLLLLLLWSFRFLIFGFSISYKLYVFEAWLSLIYVFSFPVIYSVWLYPRLVNSIQVFKDYLIIKKRNYEEKINFSEISQIDFYFGSVFSFKVKTGRKYFFNSDLERIDYVWENFYKARPDLVSKELYSEIQVKLVRADHNQKRKEWFLKHRFIDVVCWFVLPISFMFLAYFFQSKDVQIYQVGMYFFRLFMYSLLTLLLISLGYSLLLKKLIFDKKFDEHLKDHHSLSKEEKVRDLDYENVVIQKSKVFQVILATFVFALIIKSDFNLFSISKPKHDLSHFKIPKGKTVVIDNRFNCFECKYGLKDGDLIVHGLGGIAQIIAKEGEPVGEVLQDTKGRTIASVSVQEVPKGHVAVKPSNSKEIIFIRLVDIIGKLEK